MPDLDRPFRPLRLVCPFWWMTSVVEPHLRVISLHLGSDLNDPVYHSVRGVCVAVWVHATRLLGVVIDG